MQAMTSRMQKSASISTYISRLTCIAASYADRLPRVVVSSFKKVKWNDDKANKKKLQLYTDSCYLPCIKSKNSSVA